MAQQVESADDDGWAARFAEAQRADELVQPRYSSMSMISDPNGDGRRLVALTPSEKAAIDKDAEFPYARFKWVEADAETGAPTESKMAMDADLEADPLADDPAAWALRCLGYEYGRSEASGGALKLRKCLDHSRGFEWKGQFNYDLVAVACAAYCKARLESLCGLVAAPLGGATTGWW